MGGDRIMVDRINNRQVSLEVLDELLPPLYRLRPVDLTEKKRVLVLSDSCHDIVEQYDVAMVDGGTRVDYVYDSEIIVKDAWKYFLAKGK
jgi:hypothetical protein